MQASGPLDFVSVVVCLPTYNESGHIIRLIEAIRSGLSTAHILVIDDASPDGTGKLVQDRARVDPHIHLLNRTRKTGLGDAYRAGFAYAIKTWNPRFLVQMDADFSHPVEVLPTLLAQAGVNDLVIGSRYVASGGALHWHRLRRSISWFGCAYAQSCLGLPIADPTSGLRVWHADLLRQVLSRGISSRGYAFQIETTLIALRLGANIAEVPFQFDQRASGHSKMSLAIATEALWRIPWLRWTHAGVRRSIPAPTDRKSIAR